MQPIKVLSSFSVDDLDKAREFYKNKLGLTVVDDPMGVIELKFEEANNIFIYPKENHSPATFTVLNFIVNNIEDSVDELIAKGVKFEQYTGEIETDEKGICRNPRGPAIAWFKDAAGNILSVLEKS